MKISTKIKNYLFLISQKTKESLLISEVIYSALLPIGVVLNTLGKKTASFKLVSQVHRSSRLPFLRSLSIPTIKKTMSAHYTPRHPNFTLDQFKNYLGKRVLCIKPHISSEEKGVLLIKYSESMPLLPYYCDMERLLKDYTLVYEPSWSGYCTTDIVHFTSYAENIFMLAKQRDDYNFLKEIDSNILPLPMGPCDWVNPKIAEPYLNSEKEFDIVLNSNWGAPKRHHVLFKALSEMSNKLRVALIGFDWGERTREDVLSLARYYNVEDQLTIFEKISFEEVMKINSKSKVALLLSLKEGSNRAIAEGLFCDTPAIVLKNHVGGIVENINEKTGRLVSESNLAIEIEDMLNDLSKYQPRTWALNNISCFASTEKLKDALKAEAVKQGRAWTQDIVVRTNSPELRYYDPSAAEQCIAEHSRLEMYISLRS
jgi:hypothetical protein